MSRTRNLSDLIRRTFDGPMWHGPALSEVLAGVTHDQAARYGIPGAHSIWELVLHMKTWADVARARLGGDPMKLVPPEVDFPPPEGRSAEAWGQAVAALDASYRSLAADVERLDDSRLDERVVEHDYSIRTMLHGVVEHGCYHGGQIALLKKNL